MKVLGKVEVEIMMWEAAAGITTDINKISSYYKLGKDNYLPLSDNNDVITTNEDLERLNKESKKKPIKLGKVKEHFIVGRKPTISDDMLNKLWMYDSRIYEENRNDYNEEQVTLLIYQCIDKEKRTFDNLRKKYGKKP